jgi:hypothetical protein
LYGCAQINPLSGGPQDIYAPAIDSAKTSPSNGQTNFSSNEVRMRFDEFIKLNNPKENILIIPQQNETPEIIAKNKNLNIIFKDELIKNTTYTITFNGAIQDITEKNDSVFQYVFSTGSYIDSLSVNGKVQDAFTNVPEKQVLVGLYPKGLQANFDSIPYKYKPMYLAQSDAQGMFQLNYLKDGTYYIFAIKDKNKNLLYDQGESFSFIKEQSFLLSSNDSSNFLMRTFTEESKECFVDEVRFDYPGKFEIILSNPTDSIYVTSSIGLMQEETGSKDSLIFWLDQPPAKNTQFFIDLLGEIDTIKPIYENIPDKIETVKLKNENNVKTGKLIPGEDLILTFSEPVKEVDMSKVHFMDIDSNEVTIDNYKINVRDVIFSTFGTLAHEIVVDSSAVNSVYGRINEKQIKVLFDNEKEDFYGTLIVSVDTVFSEPVIVHLLNSKTEVVDTIDFAQKMTFEKLLPGDYQLRLIIDVDNNGEWTSGSLAEGREPESVVYNGEAIKVKSKWEKEVEWNFKK